MITESFDNRSEAIISPSAMFGEKKQVCRTAIGTFSVEIQAAVLERYPHETIGEIRAVNGTRPIHLLMVGALKTAFYLSGVGSTMAATDVIEMNWKTGADRFILFGSAGALDREAVSGKYILPTEAYRDEGMSYHYAPPADYIRVRNAEYLAALFEQHHLPFVQGRVWTTDAFYRETRDLVRKRRSEGCLAVEMELAGLQAVCDFHGLELYDFLLAGDLVDQPVYTPEGLQEANHSMDKLDIALMIAENIAEL